MTDYSWLEELEMLLARFSHLGISPGPAALSIVEAWGLYRLLVRLAGDA